MVQYANCPELFQGLPVQRVPSTGYLNLYTLIPFLLELYPDWVESDLQNFVEEKTGRRIHPEDQTTMIAVYQRCIRLRHEFEV